MGLLGAMALRVAEFETFMYSREQEPDPRIEVAKAIGATYLSSQTIPIHRLKAQIGPIDLVYEAVGILYWHWKCCARWDPMAFIF